MVDASGRSRPISTRSVHRVDGSLTRELSLYNGISNRSRGWKTKKSDKTPELRSSRMSSVRRWDGAAMSSNAWDNLKRDPELWHRDGNCYIHLYGQGQSRRGPAFKVPFSGLLKADCYPFIDRFMSRNIVASAGHVQDDNADPARRSRIELFIPAPPPSDKQQSYEYHLATRNFIAYVFRRSMVGENLGDSLITLMHSMHEFRTEGVDNVQDLMSYLDEEGYLNFKNHPTHALAILRLAEIFQLRGLYIDAFAHCCGMSDQLPTSSEYQLVSPGTRQLIRCARVEMNLRLGQSANMVGTFLRYELSEAHLGLYAGARAHLERLRTLLHDFYAVKFGSYPPPSINYQTRIFEVEVFRTMREDFEALFHYLVDETLDTSQDTPFLTEGGICTWQSIKSFDTTHEFKTLFHPLPLLPKVPQENTKRMSWLGAPMKSDRKRKENTHAALLTATNQRAGLLKNGLVRLYRQFEEDLVYLSTKADKFENLGPMDSRKVRWILIYATYQALRQATEIPPEVRDATHSPYHLCISTADLPPWDEERPICTLVRSQTDHIGRNSPIPPLERASHGSPTPRQRSFEIKPDIDYFALTRRQMSTSEARDGGSRLRRATSWRGSFTSNLSRSLSTRRSMTKLTKPQPGRISHPVRQAQYHEIVVQGYGNGTNDIKPSLGDLRPPESRVTIAEEPVSTSSSRYSSSTSDLRKSEESSVAKTSDTSTSVYESLAEACLCSHRRASSSYTRHGKGCSSQEPTQRRPGSSCTGIRRKLQDDAPFEVSCGLIRRRSRSVDSDSRKFMEPAPLNIRKVSSVASHIEMPAPKTPTSWDYVKAVMEVKASSWMVNDVHPEWEQYNDLGGLTEFSSGVPGLLPLKVKAPSATQPRNGEV
ncbi:hypothetical protein F5Y06DRAFT_194912 [Hypoxylon sp. FL0890]|nr:hypothetical protein F5Y06DRAFT_194912 [Hypoxylon sp. FL0890]